MATLSVVLATHNEENNIEACLASVKDLADEIIVVDGSSTDSTVAIAKQLGAKVKITTNKPIFHINKQIAIDMATKDWVLQLDADERISADLKKEIKSVIDKKDTGINGYWIPRKNLFLGRYLMKGGQYPDYTMRLYRRGYGKLPQKDVHEQAVVKGEVGYLVHPITHLADESFGRYLMRYNRYTDLIADDLCSKKNAGNLFIAVNYLILSPTIWFLSTYIRHKGFMDSWQGFVFSFFSSIRFPIGYIKYLARK